MTEKPGHPSGDPGVFGAEELEALFRECAADVHGYLISLLGDRASAEDATALAFERLYRHRGRLDRGRGTPRALLFSIARNAALDELRRRGRRGAPQDMETFAAVADPEETLADAERRETVRAALAALPLRDREIVLLKFHGQLSHSEIARALGISESTAGTRLHRALTRLRAACAEPDRMEAA